MIGDASNGDHRPTSEEANNAEAISADAEREKARIYKVLDNLDESLIQKKVEMPKEERDREALEAAVNALYLGDNSDYKSALLTVVLNLDPELYKTFQDNPQEAYDIMQKRVDPNYKREE